MSTAVLATADLVASANTTLYTVPANTQGSFSISICNRGNEIVLLRVSMSNNVTPQLAEFIEYDTQIPPTTVFERTGLIGTPNLLFIVRTDKANVSAVCYGYTDSTL